VAEARAEAGTGTPGATEAARAAEARAVAATVGTDIAKAARVDMDMDTAAKAARVDMDIGDMDMAAKAARVDTERAFKRDGL